MTDLDTLHQQGVDLLTELASRWSAADAAAALASALGILCAGVGDRDSNLLAALTVIERAAGSKLSGSMALQMPCGNCWDSVVATVVDRRYTGTVRHRCPHHALAFVVQAQAGAVMRWSVSPAPEGTPSAVH